MSMTHRDRSCALAWPCMGASVCACADGARHDAGYWRHQGVWPGTSYQGHNHCWNAVKVDGQWRLVDCAASALDRGFVHFFNEPAHFRMTYLPLNAPWSLQRQYITNEEFWQQPWCHVQLYNTGCRLLTAGLGAVNQLKPSETLGFLPARSLAIAVAPGYRCDL